MAISQALEQDARAILTRNELPCSLIVAVDRDSILYVNGQGKARTAWLHTPSYGKVKVEMVPGFAADPPDDWHPPPQPINYGLAAQTEPE